MTPVLYISVELKVRDLDPRLLVAAEALKAGLHVIIGQQWALSKNIFNVPQGVFLFKTVNEIQATHMVDAKDAGHFVTASDEEVLACSSDYCFRSAMGPTAAKMLDRFYAQGTHHGEIIEDEFPELSGKIVTTGNPRIDLLSSWGRNLFSKDAQRIKNQFGSFILFNTNFGWVNSIWNASEDTKQILIRTGRLNLEDPESIARYEETVNWEQANLDEIDKTITWVANNITSHSIIIRPHPAEDQAFWSSRFQDHPRVSVITEGSHIPWTIAADLMVHTSCSTGMEAAVLGTPALSITPRPDARQHMNLLSNKINVSVETWQAAGEFLHGFLSAGGVASEMSETAQSILSSSFKDFGAGSSAGNIIDDVTKLLGTDTCAKTSQFNWAPLPGHSWIQVDRRPEWKQKFIVEDEEIADRIGAMANLVGLKKTINLQRIDDSLYHIFPR